MMEFTETVAYLPDDTNEIEIGSAETEIRRKRAMSRAAPKSVPPASAHIEPVDKPVRKRRAGNQTSPSQVAPGVSLIGHNSDAVVGGDGQAGSDTQPGRAVSAIVNELVAKQRQRQFCIVQKNRSERAIESLIASTMGFRLDATEKDRKEVFARAKAFRLSVERGGEGQSDLDTHFNAALSAIAPLILISADNRKPWVDLRTTVEKDMAKLTRDLPVHEFAKSVRGFGELGLACLVAEAGIPIGEYRTVSGLWKRMGLAVFDGKRQQKCRDKNEAELHGYSPKRRAEVWAFCSDSMFRAQWRGADEEAGLPARSNGHYGDVYARRRAITDLRIEPTSGLDAGDRDKWTKGRSHNDARRVMSKALLRDLWRVWNGMEPRKIEMPGDGPGEASSGATPRA